jgi:hypothetical protein
MAQQDPVASIWPYKVVLPLEVSKRAEVTAHVKLSSDLGLCRPHGRVRGRGPNHEAFCFTSKKHAEDFNQRFGGYLIDKTAEAQG